MPHMQIMPHKFGVEARHPVGGARLGETLGRQSPTNKQEKRKNCAPPSTSVYVSLLATPSNVMAKKSAAMEADNDVKQDDGSGNFLWELERTTTLDDSTSGTRGATTR